MKKASIRARFEAKVDRSGGTNACHLWTGAVNEHGYGGMRFGGKNYVQGKLHRAHRLAMEFALGEPVPDGLFVLHKCDNPPCVNPLHLFIGDQKANMSDAATKGRLYGRRTNAPKGSRNGHSKLTEAQVLEIRASDRPYLLGRSLGVTKGVVCSILKGLKWKHLPIASSWSVLPRSARRGALHSSKVGAK